MPLVSQDNECASNQIKVDDFWQNQDFPFTITKTTKILSLVQKIPAVDPLAIFQEFAPDNTSRFYWEKPSKQEAVAAWGVTRSLVFESNTRFKKTQEFTHNCFEQLIKEGDTNLVGSDPRIFCSFSFFPKSNQLTIISDSESLSSPEVDQGSPNQKSQNSSRIGKNEIGNSSPAASIFLPRFQITKKNKSYFLIINFPVRNQQEIEPLISKLRQKTKSIDWEKYQQPIITEKKPRNWDNQNLFSAANSGYFKSTVRSALESIAVDELSKIVIAHAIDIKANVPFDVINSLHNLRDRHSDCYIFAIGNAQKQNFIGASPERLVSIQNGQLVTDALAGSAPRGKSTSEDLQWANILLKNRKEKREHKAVSDFILEQLKLMGLKPHQLPLQLLSLSNIQHLWTPIYAHLSKDIKPLDVVEQLHPTPAVAGVPRGVVCKKISHYEKFDRALYAAPLGWVDQDDNCEFVVGIRSALIEKNQARLYAGAGIVSGSNPDKEFIEIQLKLQSLLKALV